MNSNKRINCRLSTEKRELLNKKMKSFGFNNLSKFIDYLIFESKNEAQNDNNRDLILTQNSNKTIGIINSNFDLTFKLLRKIYLSNKIMINIFNDFIVDIVLDDKDKKDKWSDKLDFARKNSADLMEKELKNDL